MLLETSLEGLYHSQLHSHIEATVPESNYLSYVQSCSLHASWPTEGTFQRLARMLCG